MREYAKVSPRFWSGATGRQIRSYGAEAQLVALYLLTCPGSSMTGIYYLPIPTLAHETGLPIEGASKALRSLSEAKFAFYDEASEMVWVPEMAHHQLGPTLQPKDKRHVGLLKELMAHRCAFIQDFYNRYRVDYSLPKSPFEAPSKPLRSQEKEKEKEKDDEDNTAAVSRGPSNLNEALAVPLQQRAQYVLDNPHCAAWVTPHRWPEVEQVVATFEAAAGIRAPRLTGAPRDKSTPAAVQLFAAGFSLDDCRTAFPKIVASEWWRANGSGFAQVSETVMSRALNGDAAAKPKVVDDGYQ